MLSGTVREENNNDEIDEGGGNRNGALDFQKFIFALVIAIFHGKHFADVSDQFFFLGGAIGVEFFFLLAGCLMGQSASKTLCEDSVGKDTFLFIKRKISRLLPDYYIMWFIAFIVMNIQTPTLKGVLRNCVSCIWELLFLDQSGLQSYRANDITWYLSAMLLALLLLYPLLRKFGDNFFYLIAPVIYILLMGYTYREWKSYGLTPSLVWNGYVFRGLLRAIMSVAGGCICYKLAEAIAAKTYTKFSRILFSFFEWGSYLCVLWFSWGHAPSELDWIKLFFLMVGLTITYSRCSMVDLIFQNKAFYWLGEYSFALYLGHGCWRYALKNVLPGTWTYTQKLCLYLAISAATAIVLMYSSKGLKKLWKKIGASVKAVFVEVDG